MSVIFEDLKGKHVLITGGTGGIGGGLTPAFAQQGWSFHDIGERTPSNQEVTAKRFGRKRRVF